MKFRYLAFALLLFTPFVTVAAADDKDDKDVKLTGCLIRGDGDGGGYLLTSRAFDPAATPNGGTPVAPGTIGTTGDYANIFYWLDDDGDLKKHVGHQVEIEGHVKGDVKDGEMKLDRKDAWTELTVKSDGRTMNARVPNSSIVAGPDPKRKLNLLVRKVDVDHVKMLAATCQ